MICFKATERMALDLNRVAAISERSMSDFLYSMVRQRMYGDIERLSKNAQLMT